MMATIFLYKDNAHYFPVIMFFASSTLLSGAYINKVRGYIRNYNSMFGRIIYRAERPKEFFINQFIRVAVAVILLIIAVVSSIPK